MKVTNIEEIDDVTIINLYHKSKEIYRVDPICVLSHKRSNNKTLNELKDHNDLLVYVFVYKNEVDEYKEVWKEYSHIKIIPAECNKGIGFKRQFVCEYMFKENHNSIFQVDDDFVYGFISGHKNNSKFQASLQINLYEALKIAMVAKEYFNTDSIIRGGTTAIFKAFNEKNVLLKNDHIGAMFHIDLEGFHRFNLCWDQSTFEDVDMFLQCLVNGKKTDAYMFLNFQFGMYGMKGFEYKGGLYDDYKSGIMDNRYLKLAEKWPLYYNNNTKKMNFGLMRKDFNKYGKIKAEKSKKLF